MEKWKDGCVAEGMRVWWKGWRCGRMNGVYRKGWRCGRRDRSASSGMGCHERAGGKTGPIWEWQAGQI